MRVMLMTQKPGGNVACSPLSPPYHYSGESDRDWLTRCTDWANRVRPPHARWWLVEATNAESARGVIRCAEGDCRDSECEGCVCRRYGRVLTSGGRS